GGRRRRLGPREAGAARERDDAPGRVHGVEGAVRAERGLPDRRADGIHATAAEIEREQLMLGRRDEQKLGFWIEPDDALHGGQFALQHPLDGGKPGEAVELRRPAFGGQPDRDAGRAREDLEFANTLWGLLL